MKKVILTEFNPLQVIQHMVARDDIVVKLHSRVDISDFMEKIISDKSEIPLDRIRAGDMNETEMMALKGAVRWIANYDRSLSFEVSNGKVAEDICH